MDNASEALKMAAAMLLFVGALSIAVFVLSKARLASASIMAKKDATRSYYSIENEEDEKIVGIDTVITNMYNYYQTQSTILFYKKTSESSPEVPVALYYTEASDVINPSKGLTESTLDKATLSIMNATNKDNAKNHHAPENLKDKRSIFGIDIQDELTRQEPWTRNEETSKKFIDSLVNRVFSPGYDISIYSSLSTEAEGTQNSTRGFFDDSGNVFRKVGEHYDVTTGRNINEYQLFMGFAYGFNGTKPLIELQNARFIERVGIYNYEAYYKHEYVDDPIMGENYLQSSYVNSSLDPSRIYFDETDESIDNNKSEKKTVIEYIYLAY